MIYFISGLIVLVGVFAGYQPYFRIEKLSKGILLNSILIVAVLFTILMVAYITGYFPDSAAAPFMMFVYSFLAGFFAGYAWRIVRLRKNAGNILYVYRSFWTDHAPAFAAVMVILYGIYRTSLLLEQPITGIRLTSGFSLITFGLLGLTIKIVPEFRSKGIFFLDRVIPWKQVIAWHWDSEDVINIEFIYKPGKPDEHVREFYTAIPPEDRAQIETVLDSKMDDSREYREEILGIKKK